MQMIQFLQVDVVDDDRSPVHAAHACMATSDKPRPYTYCTSEKHQLWGYVAGEQVLELFELHNRGEIGAV